MTTNLPYKRKDRLKKLVHKTVAQLIQEMKDPRSSFVTITEVEISEDAKSAKIYYTTLNPDVVHEVETMFTHAKGFLRTQLAHKLMLKKALQLEFVYDKYLIRTQRVLALLDKIKDENS